MCPKRFQGNPPKILHLKNSKEKKIREISNDWEKNPKLKKFFCFKRVTKKLGRAKNMLNKIGKTIKIIGINIKYFESKKRGNIIQCKLTKK